MNKNCEYCGQLMENVRSDKQYCSRSCQAKASRERKKFSIDLTKKICPRCNNEFTIKTSGYNRAYCYECVPEENQPRTGGQMRALIKKWVLEEKGGKCCKCGYCKCQEALELHHLNPNEKDFSISDRNLKYGDWSTIKKEINKCILVCANCHREIHAQELKGE